MAAMNTNTTKTQAETRNFGDDVTNTADTASGVIGQKRRSSITAADAGDSKRHKSNENSIECELEANPRAAKRFKADIEDEDKPQASAEYAQTIIKNLIARQERYRFPEGFLESMLLTKEAMDEATGKARGINGRIRTIMLGWLHKVWAQFELKDEVLYCTASLLDRICALYHEAGKPMVREKYQLYACTCLWISSKYHEIYAPEMRDFVHISQRAFTQDDLKACETEILCAIDWDITTPSVLTFARRFIRVAQPHMSGLRKERAVHVAMYFCENSILDHKMLRYDPALIAATALSLGLMMTRSGSWPDELVRCSGYTSADIQTGDLLKQVRSYIMEPTKEHASVRDRYSKADKGSVSLLVPKIPETLSSEKG